MTLDFRWKVLVLVADSAAGKSSFGKALFERPCVVTLEEAEHLDLKNFHFGVPKVFTTLASCDFRDVLKNPFRCAESFDYS